MVHFAIDAQLTADKAMADVIAKAPRPLPQSIPRR
jgi:hypothetical protein